jgi:4'-phosphopantetheinyl transferase EntD
VLDPCSKANIAASSSRRAAGVSPLFGGITHSATNAITIIAPRENRTAENAENAVMRGGFQPRQPASAVPSRRAAGVSPLFGGITHGATNAITIIAQRE